MPVVRPPRELPGPSVISEVTRRNIFDAISAMGLSWAGRLQEDEFLARIYDLEKMPSEDHRYKTALADIRQHRVRNDDWNGPGWIFDDARFDLHWCEDELFLRFLAETIHPVVRADPGEVDSLLAAYNEQLLNDGWSLRSATTISGRPVFEGRRVEPTRRTAPIQATPSVTASALADFLPKELAGRFEIVQHLGTGSFAAVYQVVDSDSDQRFALKVTANTPEARERAHREADAAAKLSHPNIVEVIEADPAARWFLLPLAEGTLGQLQAWRRLGSSAAIEIATFVGSALQHAHAFDFIHRDLHPDNVLRIDGRWTVADWGLAVARSHQRLTRTKSVGGTATWTAPEQLRSLKDADERSDLFSLGRLVQWLASGELPDVTKPGELDAAHPCARFVDATTRLARDERPPSVQAALELLPDEPAWRVSVNIGAAMSSRPASIIASQDERLGRTSSSSDVTLTLDYEKIRITREHHDYELVVILKNAARRRLDDWELEIEFPTGLLGSTIYGIKVEERSNATITFFRVDGRELKKPLRPGDEQSIRIAYFVNKELYWNRKEIFAETAKARALVDGSIVAEIERPLSELENF